jgi:rhomboid protease GluP
VIPAALVVACLTFGVLCGRRLTRGLPGAFRPTGTLMLAALVAAGLAAQLAAPWLLAAFGRDAAAIEADGSWWRLLTALFLQDGGLAGGAFNLAALVFVGAAAERLWGTAVLLALYFGCGIAAGVVALGWQPTGAGNSIAILGLCGAILALGLRRGPDAPTTLLATAGLAGGIALAMLRDVHGAALLIGAVAGIALPPPAAGDHAP